MSKYIQSEPDICITNSDYIVFSRCQFQTTACLLCTYVFHLTANINSVPNIYSSVQNGTNRKFDHLLSSNKLAGGPSFQNIRAIEINRVPTVMEKSWKMTGHGKVMEKSWKIIGHGKVMEFSRSWKKSWKTQIWTNLFCRFCRTSCFERVFKFCNKYF